MRVYSLLAQTFKTEPRGGWAIVHRFPVPRGRRAHPSSALSIAVRSAVDIDRRALIVIDAAGIAVLLQGVV